MVRQFHIQCQEGDIAPYVLLPGDPGRVPIVAAHWDESHKVGQNREYVTYTGAYKGVPITCTSTGIGCPSTAIAVEELARVWGLRAGTVAVVLDSVMHADDEAGHFDPAAVFADGRESVELMARVASEAVVRLHGREQKP